ncbi:hypothetical protein [Sorangium sp. So ce233]
MKDALVDLPSLLARAGQLHDLTERREDEDLGQGQDLVGHGGRSSGAGG